MNCNFLLNHHIKKENEEHADNKPISFYKQKILPVCINGTFYIKADYDLWFLQEI